MRQIQILFQNKIGIIFWKDQPLNKCGFMVAKKKRGKQEGSKGAEVEK